MRPYTCPVCGRTHAEVLALFDAAIANEAG